MEMDQKVTIHVSFYLKHSKDNVLITVRPRPNRNVVLLKAGFPTGEKHAINDMNM